MAKGRGSGAVDEGGVLAGGACAVFMAIYFCVFGIPVILTGIIMIAIAPSGHIVWVVGLILVIISALVLVAGSVVIVLLCTGKFKKADQVSTIGPQTVVMHQAGYAGHTHQMTAGGVPPPAYGSQQQAPPQYSGQQQAPPQYSGQQQAPPQYSGQQQDPAYPPVYPPPPPDKY